MKIVIRGVVYEDVETASKELGVSPSTIYAAAKRSRLDFVGTGPGTGRKKRGGKPVKIGSTIFPSMSDASKALGMSKFYVHFVLTRGGQRAKDKFLLRMMQYERSKK